jgi:hypothetical protein
MHRLGLAALALALVLPAAARAEEPPHYTFAPTPPGTIVQSQLVYLAGEAMHSQWRAVLSKVSAQWYLSIYAIDETTYRLKYRSPKSATPFGFGAGVNAASLTSAELMGPGVQQLVVTSHTPGAGCGSARVDVLFFDAAMQIVMPTLSLRNQCRLSVRVIHDAGGIALAVSGPYFAPGSQACCPTDPNATAILRFSDGAWSESPRYFPIVLGD